MNRDNTRTASPLPRFFDFLLKSRWALQNELSKRDSIIHDLKTSLCEAEAKTEDAKLDAQIAQDELEDERQEHQHAVNILAMRTGEVEHLQKQLICLRDNISDLAAGNFEKVYESICGTLDPEGWQLYRAAKKYTGVDPSHVFPTEDNLGYFDVLNGNGLIYWVEVYAFGKCKCRQLDCGGGYELSSERVIHKDTEAYRQYRKVICKQVVQNLLGLEAEKNV